MKRMYDPRFIALAFTCICFIASFYLYLSVDTHGGRQWHAYNNYLIFKYAHLHLINGQSLYTESVPYYWDIYKYTPAFAFLMGAFAYLPDLAGLFGWNLLNVLVLFYGIWLLPLSTKKKCLLLWFISLELLTTIQGMQSNALMAGLLLMAFHCFENRRLWLAALLITLAAYIKGYAAIGFVLLLFYPGKEKLVIYAALSLFIVFLLPLVAISPVELIHHYRDWFRMMYYDHGISYGLSLMGLIRSWFDIDIKTPVMITGLLFFLVPLLRTGQYNDLQYRLKFVAMMFVWLIIFNHKAESQTYIIAVAGAAIWYHTNQLSSRKWLMLFLFIGTCVAHTDMMPMFLKKEFIYPYHIKALPAIVIWCFMMADLLAYRKTAAENSNLQPNSAYHEQMAGG